MPRLLTLCLALLGAVPVATFAATAQAPTTAPAVVAMYVEVYVKGDRRDVKVAGRLIDHDADSITLQTATETRRLRWDELTPSTAFTLKSRLINPASAADWLALGRWGWGQGLEGPSRTAFAKATKLDGGLAGQVAQITATRAGGALARSPASQPAEPMLTGQPTTKPTPTTGPRFTRAGRRGGEPIVTYRTPSADANAASIALSRKRRAEVEKTLDLKLAEVESPHFLIYTDWDPSEYGFLKNECEGAYRAVAQQFNRSAKENVFVGKLPIYMFVKADSFKKFSEDVDGHPVPPTVLGYFVPVEEMGHMAMWKPTIGAEGINAEGTLESAKRRWGRTLIHEFVHAFVHRYRTNAWVPRWLNEGLAEVIAEGALPSNNYYELARLAANDPSADVASLFDDNNMPTGEAYPVMMSMVEYLARRDRARFLPFFNDLKDGTPPEEALQKAYGLDYKSFITAWREYARSLS